LEIPEKINVQAEWEFELALAALEGACPPTSSPTTSSPR